MHFISDNDILFTEMQPCAKRECGMVGLIVVSVFVALLVVLVIGIYNKLVRGRNEVKNSFSQIDVQLKRRYDLIPNLVETAKAYLKHESETLTAVVSARNAAAGAEARAAANPSDAGSMQALSKAEGALQGAMGRLLAVFESYPDLKADSTMNSLMEELKSTENRIAFARQHYNDSVMEYNNSREQFPAVLFAGPLGFQAAASFEIENPQEREPVRVAFS